MSRSRGKVTPDALPEDVSRRRGWRPARQVADVTKTKLIVEEQASRHDAALKETFGAVPDLGVLSRDEWERG